MLAVDGGCWVAACSLVASPGLLQLLQYYVGAIYIVPAFPASSTPDLSQSWLRACGLERPASGLGAEARGSMMQIASSVTDSRKASAGENSCCWPGTFIHPQYVQQSQYCHFLSSFPISDPLDDTLDDFRS